MDTGIPVNDACVLKFADLNRKKAHRFLIFGIEENKEVVVRFASERDATWEDFVKALTAQPSYGVFDLEFQHEGGNRAKVLLFSYIPDSIGARVKMVYAGTKKSLMNALDFNSDIHISDVADLDLDAIVAKAKK